jgi:disulfide oxidoreductase YuzD
MVVNWIKDFFVPLLKALVIVAVFGTILILMIYYIRKYYKIKAKWFIRYGLLRRKYDPDIVKFCVEYIDIDRSYYDVKKIMLINNFTDDELYNVLYIFKKISKQMNGTINYGRQIKKYNFKNGNKF